MKKQTGVISVSSRGTGYVPLEGFEKDIEISAEELNTALHGDLVEIALLKRERGRKTGKVLRVIERAKTEFVGALVRENGTWLLKADDRRMYTKIRIPHPPNNVGEGLKALVALETWNNPKNTPEGNIKEVLGPKGEHAVEMHAIVLEHGFATNFPEEVLAEAKELGQFRKIPPEEIARRRDFREITTFTIDPVDAKDFDDALSVRTLSDGTVEVGIHIADVSHYVKPGTTLDREARKRATSIYLVDRTIPMLPEILSNDICSLNPNEDKLTFSAVFTLDKRGRVLTRWFGETIINSNKRFTYEEAQAILDAKSGLHHPELETLNSLAYALRAERARAGSINFDQDEIKFKLDPEGRPLGVYKKERLATNLLIEDFMLLANREIAEFVYTHAKKKGVRDRAFIYRIHGVPKADRLEELEVFLRAIGYELRSHSKTVTPHYIRTLFKQIEGTPEENLIKVATIRSMAKAVYSTKNVGHFGLAFKYYTNFTSPIRRYPDIMVHRIMRHHVSGTNIPEYELASYESIAIAASEREVEAAEAERDSIKYNQAEFMPGNVGKTFEAIVSGVAEWGIYVEEVETKAEGLVRMRALGSDYFVLDKKNYRVVGERTKKTYSLGDRLRVKLVSADLDTRTIDWSLA